MTFKAAKCPNCAGDLQVPDDRDSVKCMYCGSDIVVREAIKAAAGGVNIENLMMLAKTAEDSKKYEEAYKYYSIVLEYDPSNPEAWFGKGVTEYPDKHEEHLRNCFNNALKYAFSKSNMKDKIIESLTNLPPYDIVPGTNVLLEIDPNNINGLLTKAKNQNTVELSEFEYLDKALSLRNDQETRAKVVELLIDKIYDILNNYSAFGYHPEGRLLITINKCIRKVLSIQNDKETKKKIINKFKAGVDYSGSDSRISNRIRSFFDYPQCENSRKAFEDLIKLLNEIDENGDKRGIIEIKKSIIGYLIDSPIWFDLSRNDPEGNYRTESRKFIETLIKETHYEIPDSRGSQMSIHYSNQKWCFIATAAFGSPLSSEVVLLQKFRDNHLETNSFGKYFVKVYYRLSPPIARVIGNSEFLKAITRQILKPIIMLLKHHQGGSA